MGVDEENPIPASELFATAKRLLTPHQYDAVMLCWALGWTHSRAGFALGIAEDSVRSRLRGARHRLVRELAKEAV